jgi:hypothetical protein
VRKRCSIELLSNEATTSETKAAEEEDEEGEVEVSRDESGDWRLASSQDSKREERM